MLHIAALAVVLPVGGGLVMVAVLAGANPEVAHFGHFYGFLFGAAIEGIYVVSEKERERFQQEQEGGASLMHER
jgi:membrane associated rhomboid family serine protease